MATGALNQYAGAASSNYGQQFNPYPYNGASGAAYSQQYGVGGAAYNDQYTTNGGTYSDQYQDQYTSASFPQAQVQNFIQSAPPGVTQTLAQNRETTVTRAGGRGRKQQPRRAGGRRKDGGQTVGATPVEGPILMKNGKVPVVPLYSYPSVKNGTFVQVPIFWTALSIALGYEVRGEEAIRGLPCIIRANQLFCINPGSQYPVDRIEVFIDENKALIRRMFGDFAPPGDFFNEPRLKRSPDNSTMPAPPVPQHRRVKRQRVPTPPKIDKGSKNLVDSCESKVEIITPYWAANSAGEIRAIVNTKHFPQAIHQELCKGTSTSRCGSGCICEQKYTYHRLLAYDPDNDCKGIFIDWFLFPSCCACRCPP